MGLLWVPLAFNGMAFGSWMEGIEWYRNSAPSAVVEATVLAIILSGIGFLVIFKKALGWYLIWLILSVLGVIFLSMFVGITYSYLAGIGYGADIFGVGMFFVLSVFFLTLLWIQVRYWRRRKALI